MTALRVFVPFALGFFLSYLLRVVNAVIAPDLVREVGLTAADLGLLTSANFFAFAAFQLPLGILLDRFGPRRTEAALLLFAALGAFIFSAAVSAPGLIAGRALIGLGTSACLMAAFKAYVMWFPGKRIPLVNGCQMAAGGLGAITGTVPVEAALAFTDWRGVFVILGVMALVFAAAIYLVVPRRKIVETAADSMKDHLAGIAQVFTNPLFWRIAPMTVASHSMFLGTQTLWSGPWLADVAGLGRDAVAHHLLMIAVAMVAGFLGIGTIAERLDQLGVRTIQVAVAGMSLFTCVQLILVAQWTGAVLPTWMLFGFFGTSGMLSYAVLPQSFAPELAGRVITGLNVLTFAGAFAAQWGIGAIINLWPAAGDGGYSPEGYQAAFALMVVLQIASLVWYAVFRKV
jgi:sugar phosphate permease